MCEASPGPRCAADTRAAASVTLNVYESAHPQGPAVDPLESSRAHFSVENTCRDEYITVPDPNDPDGFALYRGTAADAADDLAPGTYQAVGSFDSAQYELTIHEPDPNAPGGSITSDGQYSTWVGTRHVEGRQPTETAKAMRSEVRSLVKAGDLPSNFKYRVTRGQSWNCYDIHIESDNEADYFQPASDHDRAMYGVSQTLRPDVHELARRLSTIGNSYLKTTSDQQTDYHAGGYVFVYGRGGHVLG